MACHHNKWSEASIPKAKEGAVAVVTGASSGIGYDAAQMLVETGWSKVVFAVRNTQKGEDCVQKIKAELQQKNIAFADDAMEVMEVDVASLESIRGFSQAFHAKFARLDLLVNNAGVMIVDGKTKDGFELHIGTNSLGPFALTGLLLDVIAKTPDARIVNVSSSAVSMAREQDLHDYSQHLGASWASYGRSKIANVFFSNELGRRLEAAGKTDVKVVSCHPGYADTNLQFADKGSFARGLFTIGNALFSQSSRKGAWCTILAATDAQANNGDWYGPSGLGQRAGTPVKREHMSALCSNQELAARFFDQSQELTGVNIDSIIAAL